MKIDFKTLILTFLFGVFSFCAKAQEYTAS